jgi:hypothetical protein
LADERDANAQRNSASSDGPKPRRTYVAPELIEYGTVAKLTQTGGQTVADFFVFRRMMTCL